MFCLFYLYDFKYGLLNKEILNGKIFYLEVYSVDNFVQENMKIFLLLLFIVDNKYVGYVIFFER